MAKTRSWILGLGCLVILAALLAGALAIRSLATPALPDRMVLTLRFDGPLPEVAPEDPFAELMGESRLDLRTVRDALSAAAEDDDVHGVRIRLDSFGGGMAAAQEIRSLLARVRAAGKWSAAYTDTAGEFAPGNLVYFVASGCDEVSINPMGDVNLIGLSARVPFIGGTLDKLEIRPEFPGRGDYKSARFFYTERGFTPAHEEMMTWLLDSMTSQLVEGVAANRGLEPAVVSRLIDQAPFLGAEAVEAGLVDRLEDWSEFTSRLDEKAGAGVRTAPVSDYAERIRARRGGPKIAVVTGVGAILRGRSGRSLNPLLGGDVMGSETMAEAWRAVRRERGVKAVVFRVDSPGGSAIASEIIRREMVRTAEEIPVVVSMAGVAASGGYWISCGAQRIVAEGTTLTGSIGVLTGHLNLEEFYQDKLGITFGKIDRGANADLYGELDDWTDGQRAEVDQQLDRIYDAFLERVAEARGMTVEEVDAIGRGRVFTGVQAVENGLADAVGGFDVALDVARELAGIEPGAAVTLVEFPTPKPWWQRLAEPGQSRTAELELLQRWWDEGNVRLPGPVWLPPVEVR